MAILFDLDGVIYRGDRAIRGAAEVAAWAQREAIPHLFLTNTTSRPRRNLLQKLAGFGIDTNAEHILTPPVAAVQWCQQNLQGQKVALFVPDATRVEFASLPTSTTEQESVGAVVIGDLGQSWTFEVLNTAFRWLMQSPQPELLALGMTRYWQSKDGLQLDVAPFVVGLSYASGIEPRVLGKPAASFYQAAINLLGVEKDQVVMVGDDIRSDIDGAQQAGLRGVLVRTGKFRQKDLSLGICPAEVLDSVADLPDWYRAYMQV